MSNQLPSYRCKKSGRRKYALICLPDGKGGRKEVLLGAYGTKESKLEYARVLAEWQAADFRLPKADPAKDTTINEVLAAYWRYVQKYYRRENGTLTNEAGDIRLSLKPVQERYAHTLAKDFGPRAFEAIRLKMIEQPITTRIKAVDPKTGKPTWIEEVLRIGLARGVINSRIDRIRRMFKWAASKELIPVAVYQALMTVEHLQAGRSRARETQKVRPVSEALVHDTLHHLSATVADIVRLLLLTGMRAGEAAAMRGCDLDMSGRVWLYTPHHHKTTHHGHSRIVALGPRAKEIIKRYLKADLQAYLFSPRDSVNAFRKRQRQEPKSKVQPSQQSRKRRKPRKLPGERYSAAVLAGAVYRACRKHDHEPWHLHQLRHTKGTEIRRAFYLNDRARFSCMVC